MPTSKPAVLFVDLDGVLRRWGNGDAAIEVRCGLPNGSLTRVAFSPEFLTPAITGTVSDEMWRRQVAAELQRRHPRSMAHAAVAQWSASPGELEPHVLDVLSRCRNDIRLILATNATSRLGADLRALGLEQRFDAVANSSSLGVAKPNAAYFDAALSVAGVRASDALFVDDSPANVMAARQTGMNAHHFTDHAALTAFLCDAGAMSSDAG